MTSLSSPKIDSIVRINRERLFTYIDSQTSALAEGSLLVLIVIELTNVSTIDHSLGYRTGDIAVSKLQERIKKSLKKANFLVQMDRTRFALAIPGLKSRKLIPVAAEKINQLLQEPLNIDGQLVSPVCVFGIATSQNQGHSPPTLLAKAETATQTAQISQENYRFDNGSESGLSTAESSLPDLDRTSINRALAEGEISYVYQPKVDLATRRPCGLEALLRWQPEGRTKPVDTEQLMAMLEKQRLMQPVTEWTVKSVIRELRSLSFLKQPLGASVNASASDLRFSSFVDIVLNALAIWKMPAELLTVEVTESLLLEDPELSYAILQRLREHGIRVSIDDFGTGYSSLAYFKNIPADEIKIDKSFVENLEHCADDRAIVSTVISLAHRFKKRVVCEGVESLAALRLLESMECDIVQGYLFSKPLKLDELKPWLRRFDFAKDYASNT